MIKHEKFIWFRGIVEDRADPLRLGRARVRIIGHHTDDTQVLPTSSLPWATPVMPLTSASMSGVGTLSGPVEGSVVCGFFADGLAGQEPVIFGTIPGINSQEESQAFKDPTGIYPLTAYKDQPDSNMLGREEYKDSPVYKARAVLDKDIPTATAPSATAVIDDSDSGLYTKKTWSEPAYSLTPVYPHNVVTGYEAGHTVEVDSTPGNERIHTFHSSGTYEEIVHSGAKTVKIVSDKYEIILGDNNVKINGACNVTIGGDARLLVLGDMVQEVAGDYHLCVHGSMISKIMGTQATEVLTDRSVNVAGKDILRVDKSREVVTGKSHTVTTGENNTTVCGGNTSFTQQADLQLATAGKMVIIGKDGLSLGTSGVLEIGTSSTLSIKSTGALSIATDADMTETVQGGKTESITGAFASTSSTATFHNDVNVDTTLTAQTNVIGGGKSLKTHTHSGVAAGGATSGPPS